MQALKFITDHWDAIAVLLGLGAYTRSALKKRVTEALRKVAEEAAADVLKLLRKGALKAEHAVSVWEVRVREALGELGIKVTHEQALEMRRLAARKAQELFITTVLPGLEHAVTKFDESFHDMERKLANADAKLRKRSDETLATKAG